MPRRVRRTKRSHKIIVPWSAADDQKVNHGRADEVFAQLDDDMPLGYLSIVRLTPMDGIRQMLQRSVFLVLLALGACRTADDRLANMELGPPELDSLFSLPQDRTFVHEKVSPTGTNVALWVRRPNAVQLFVTGSPTVEFKGHVGFQGNLGFHAIQPIGDQDIRITGEDAERDAWLVWGPGSGPNEEPLDDYLVFDRTGSHVMYALYDMGDWSWILDNEPLAGYQQLKPPIMSDEARSIVWIESSDVGQRVVFNGEPGPTYDRIHRPSLFLSPDGAHWFYMAFQANQVLPVWDGQEQGEYSNPGLPVFSTDGDRVAYSASHDDEDRFVVVDGVEGAAYGAVTALTFSPDGRSFAHRAVQGDETFFVVNGVPEATRFDDLSNGFVFAAGGSRFAYAGARGGSWFVVVDGKSGEGAAGAFGMTFSPDGQRFARGEVSADGRMHVVVEGGGRWTHTGEPASGLTFSPDGSRVMYVIRRDSRILVAVDGVEGRDFDALASPIFAPDGSRHAVFGQTDLGTWAVFIDGEMQREFGSIPCKPTFTASGQLVYCTWQDGSWYVVIDESVGEAYDMIYLPPTGDVPLGPDGVLSYVALDGDNVVRVRHRPIER